MVNFIRKYSSKIHIKLNKNGILRLCNWCVTEDEKKELEPYFTD